MTEDELAAIENSNGCVGPWCAEDRARLLAEVRRLQRENRLLHLSRGSAPVGMD